MNNATEMVLRKDKPTKLSTLLYNNDNNVNTNNNNNNNNNLNDCDDNNEHESREIPTAYEINQRVSAAALVHLSSVASSVLSHSIALSSKRETMLLGASSVSTIPKTEVNRETGPAVETSGSISVPCTSNNNNTSNIGSSNNNNNSRKVFECDVCNMIFSNGANMRRHRMRHTGVKPYECRICQKRFFRKDHLAEHFTTHTKTLPFHCPICDRGFQRQIAMRAHFQNEHVGQHDLVKSCPLCAYHASSMKGLRVHFFNRHGVDLDNPGPHSSLLTPVTASLNTGPHLISNSISSISDPKGLLDSLANDNSNTSTISNPNSVNMSSLSGTNYQLSVFNGNNINDNYNNDNNNDEDDNDDDDDDDGDGNGDGDGERDAYDDDGELDRNFMSSKMSLNRNGTDSVSITISKAVALNELQTHSDSGDSNYGVNGNSKGTVKSSGHRNKRENKERRSIENATPPMHFLTPQVEISMASDDNEIHNAENQYNDLDSYQDNYQDHEHDNENDQGNDTSNCDVKSNGNPELSQKNQSNKFKNVLKIASSSSSSSMCLSPSPSLFLQQILADPSNSTVNEHAITANSSTSSTYNNNNIINASIIPSISLIPIKQEAIGYTDDNSDTSQIAAKTIVSNNTTNVTVTLSAAVPTAATTTAAMVTATAISTLSSSPSDTIKKQTITATAMTSRPVTATTAASIATTASTSSNSAVSITPHFSFIHTTSNNSGSGGSVGVRDTSQSNSLSSLMKVSPLKSLLKDELKRKPSTCSTNTTSRTVNMYSGGGAIGQSNNNQTMIVWPNFSKTKTQENTSQPHNLQQAITEMKCLYCGIFFPDQTLYFLHIGCHSESNPWKCNICGEQCSNIYDFNSHLLSKSH